MKFYITSIDYNATESPWIGAPLAQTATGTEGLLYQEQLRDATQWTITLEFCSRVDKEALMDLFRSNSKVKLVVDE